MRMLLDYQSGFGQGLFVEIFSQEGIFTLSFCCFYPVLGRGGCRLLFAQASRQTQFGWRLMCSSSRAGAFLVVKVALLHQRLCSVESGTSFIEKDWRYFTWSSCYCGRA